MALLREILCVLKHCCADSVVIFVDPELSRCFRLVTHEALSMARRVVPEISNLNQDSQNMSVMFVVPIATHHHTDEALGG